METEDIVDALDLALSPLVLEGVDRAAADDLQSALRPPRFCLVFDSVRAAKCTEACGPWPALRLECSSCRPRQNTTANAITFVAANQPRFGERELQTDTAAIRVVIRYSKKNTPGGP